MCFTGIGYSRIVDGETLTFGVSGKLTMNALIMFDRQTNSLWSHFLSEAIQGEYKGTRLDNVPIVLTTWEEWKESFPETKALYKGGRGGDPYELYYARDDAGVLGETNRDNRLGRKELVLGLGFDNGPIAFPHSKLEDMQLVNTELNGQPIVVYYHNETNTATVFSRVIDEQTLTFQLTTETEGDQTRDWLVDDVTGTRWLPFTGQARQGELQGRRLTSVHGVNIFWFAWNDFYPQTAIFGFEE